jgi:hypothetical protein
MQEAKKVQVSDTTMMPWNIDVGYQKNNIKRAVL